MSGDAFTQVHAARSRARALSRGVRHYRAFTLLEALVAAVVVALVAASAAMAVSVGVATQQQNRLAVLAMHAAELQMSSCMEADYATLESMAGNEDTGELLAPLRAGASTRPNLPAAFDELSRTTTVTAETRTFSQYNNISVVGKRIQVDVIGPNNTLLARLIRFRPQEDQL